MNKILFIAIGLIILNMLGCSGNKKELPPKLTLSQDACDNCFMLINEKKFAASIRLENGEAKRFDDIGCMIEFIKKNNDKVKSFWVYDYNTKNSIKADVAFFVNSKKIITPMGFGIVAFSSEKTAQDFAIKNNANVISFNYLKTKEIISKRE